MKADPALVKGVRTPSTIATRRPLPYVGISGTKAARGYLSRIERSFAALESRVFDVLVIGAGSAGVAAALAAARKGASVVVLERYSFAGGKAAGAEVGTICGLYHFSASPVSRYACSGFATEFAEKLKAMSHTEPLHNTAGLHYLPYDVFDFRLLCDQYLQHPNIELAYHATACGVNSQEGTAFRPPFRKTWEGRFR